MNFSLVRTTNISNGHKPIHLWPLNTLLKRLGVTGRWGSHKSLNLSKSGESVLWSYFESAKAIHRRRMWESHPDRGGSEETARTLNYMWTVAKERFRQLGIGQS